MAHYSDRLDHLLQVLGNMPSWNIHRFEAGADGRLRPIPWYEVTGKEITNTVALREEDLNVQITSLSAQVAFWGRMVALCERVVSWEERSYRVWRETERLQLFDDPIETTDAKGEVKLKKRTVAQVDAAFRTLPEYGEHYDRIDRAKEALTATKAVAEAFQAKKEIARTAVRRSIQDGSAELAV